jgi:hypothetical protein
MMRIECSYCKVHMGDKEPLADTRTSHGICDSCYEEEVLPVLTLDSLPECADPKTPVLVVDGEGRVVGANDAAERLTGRVHRDLGLLGGDYLDCMFAVKPGGCGKTDHCEACTVRTTVLAAIGGRTCERLPVFVRQDGQRLALTISTKAEQGLVMVTVHQVETIA